MRPRRTAAPNRAPPASPPASRASAADRASTHRALRRRRGRWRSRTSSPASRRSRRPASRLSASRDSRRRRSSSAGGIERQRAIAGARERLQDRGSVIACGSPDDARALRDRVDLHAIPRPARRRASARSARRRPCSARLRPAAALRAVRSPASRMTWRASVRPIAMRAALRCASAGSGARGARCAGGSSRRGRVARSIRPRHGNPGSTSGASTPATAPVVHRQAGFAAMPAGRDWRVHGDGPHVCAGGRVSGIFRICRPSTGRMDRRIASDTINQTQPASDASEHDRAQPDHRLAIPAPRASRVLVIARRARIACDE